MRRFLLLVVFSLPSTLSIAQTIRVEGYYFRGLPLYDEQGSRLSKEDINGLAEYGFNVHNYNRLHTVDISCDVVIHLCFATVIYAKIDHGKLIQRGNTEYYERDIIGASAVAVALLAGGVKEFCRYKVKKDLKKVNEKISIQPADSGLGLALVF